jgi:hypothetical protein
VVVVSECRTVHTCFTMANAVCTVSEDGACNNDKGGGATRLAAEYGRLVQHSWIHPMRYNIGRQRG